MAGYGLDENGNIVALGRQPGLLDDLANYAPGYEYGTILPYRINQKTKQREFAAPSIIKDMARAITAPERAYYGLLNDPQQQAMEANNFGLNLLGSGVGTSAAVAPVKGAGTVGHTVWHGSPHKFDKFDMSKIGTGEGAQAYGHGLYFAESPEVATSYQKNLGQRSLTGHADIGSIDGVSYASMDANNPGKTALNWINRWGSPSAALSSAKQQYGNSEPFVDVLQKIALGEKSYEIKTGQLYKVDIPDEILPRMLDWDKPLSQQAPEVQSAIKRYWKENNVFGNPDKLTGEGIVGSIQAHVLGNTGRAERKAANEAATMDMTQIMGIPGIRYLDGNSRGAGNGSYNYVIFDDTLPRILERNGIPTGQQPWPSLLK